MLIISSAATAASGRMPPMKVSQTVICTRAAPFTSHKAVALFLVSWFQLM